MKFCVTAANCFAGKPFVKQAIKSGNEVVAVVRPGNREIDQLASIDHVTVVELDMEDYASLGEQVGKVDCLVMLAWNGTRGEKRSNAVLQKSNYEHCLEGIRSVLASGCSCIVTAGSQAEYGSVNGVIYENTPCEPNTEYGKMKLKLCIEAGRLCTEYDAIHIEPRFFSLYGPGDNENTLIMSNIRNMQNGNTCDMTACTQLWDFLYIEDAMEALLKLCIKGKSGIYNFGSGDVRPLREYVGEMKTVLNSTSALNFGAVPYGPNGPVSINPSVSKLKEAINWAPKVSFEDGIRETLKWIEENNRERKSYECRVMSYS